MKSFDSWLRDLKVEEPPSNKPLPEGVWEYADGKYKAECISCHNYYEIYCDLDEFDPDYSYCGGGPYCVP